MAIRSYNGILPRLDKGAWIDDTALAVGDVSLGEDASLWPMVVARGDVQGIVIGARTNVQDGTVLHVTSDNQFTPGGFPLTIGADVTVGHRAVLHACTVEDWCLIGMGAIVLDGAIIRERTLLAAGSVVPPGRELEGGHLWVGSPAKRVRPLTEKELAYLEYSAQHYVELKNRHQAG